MGDGSAGLGYGTGVVGGGIVMGVVVGVALASVVGVGMALVGVAVGLGGVGNIGVGVATGDCCIQARPSSGDMLVRTTPRSITSIAR